MPCAFACQDVYADAVAKSAEIKAAMIAKWDAASRKDGKLDQFTSLSAWETLAKAQDSAPLAHRRPLLAAAKRLFEMAAEDALDAAKLARDMEWSGCGYEGYRRVCDAKKATKLEGGGIVPDEATMEAAKAALAANRAEAARLMAMVSEATQLAAKITATGGGSPMDMDERWYEQILK